MSVRVFLGSLGMSWDKGQYGRKEARREDKDGQENLTFSDHQCYLKVQPCLLDQLYGCQRCLWRDRTERGDTLTGGRL